MARCKMMRKRPIKKKLIAGGSEAKQVFIRTRGRRGENLELHYGSKYYARNKFFSLKIAHLLFPKNFPNPVRTFSGIMYSRYIPVHKELRQYQVAKFKGHLSDEKAAATIEKLMRRNAEIAALAKNCLDAGLVLDLCHVNYAITPKGIASFEVDRIIPKKLKKALSIMPIPKSRRKAVLRLLKRYEKTIFLGQ